MINFYHKKTVFVSLLFISFLPASLFAQSEKPVNLGRLEIATVEVSSVNGSRSAHDQYYGAANLFDNDSNLINDINYNYWLTDPVRGPHWVKVEFSEAVSIHRLNVLLPGKIKKTINDNLEDPNLDWVQKEFPDDWPGDYHVEIKRIQNETSYSDTYGPIKIRGNKNTHKFKDPIENVTAIRFLFPSDKMIKVQEIQILGQIEKESKYSPSKPVIMTDHREISKIGRTYLYGNVFDPIISGYSQPKVTKIKKGWEYEITMDDQVVITLIIDKDGKVISRSYKTKKK